MSAGRQTRTGERRQFRRPPQPVQIAGSILVALAIAAIAIAVVTAHFGATPAGTDDHGGGHRGRGADRSGPG